MSRTIAGAPNSPNRRNINNLVTNGDFEYAPTFVAATTTNQRWIDGTAAGSATNAIWKWAKSDTLGTSACQFDTTVSYGGLYSMKLSTQAITSRIEVANDRLLTASEITSTASNIIPSTSYTVSGYVKTNYVSGDSVDGAYIGFTQYTTTGVGITTGNTTKVKTTTDWTPYTSTFTTASNAAFLVIRMRIFGQTGTGTLIMDAWFDNVSLGLTTPQTRTTAIGRTQAGTRILVT